MKFLEIRNEFRFWCYAQKKNWQNAAELRISFIMNILGMAINNCAFILLWFLFAKAIGNLNGWTPFDIIGMQGFGAVSFGILFMFFGGIPVLCDTISDGKFDKFLSSPKNLFLRMSSSDLVTSGIGDFLFGVLCLVYYAFHIDANFLQIFLIFLYSFNASIVTISVWLICNCISFYFTDGRSLSRALIEIHLNPTLYHGGAFQGLMRFFFTFIIPSLIVAAIPIEDIKNYHISVPIFITFLSFFWFNLGLKFFYFSVKKYESGNLMG